MGIGSLFGWTASSSGDAELPEIFPISIAQSDFVKTDVISIFTKILTDVAERTHGLTEEQVSLLWDSCVMSSAPDGLITLLAKAMTDKKDLFLVFESAVGVVRVATAIEQAQIKADFEKNAESSVGTFISFKNFIRADMVKLYSALEYCTVSGLHKSMNLSKAVQLKMSDMRASVSLADSADVKTQAMALANSLSRGRDVMLDAKDSIETAVPDLTAVKESISFLNQKRSFYLGLPESYINGQQTGGIGSTGENDMRAVERGLKSYYFSVMKPVLEALFDVVLSYKSQDFRQIAGSMDVLKIFNLTDDSLVSKENKTKIMNQLLDLPEDAEGDAPPKQVSSPLQQAVGQQKQAALPAPQGASA